MVMIDVKKIDVVIMHNVMTMSSCVNKNGNDFGLWIQKNSSVALFKKKPLT